MTAPESMETLVSVEICPKPTSTHLYSMIYSTSAFWSESTLVLSSWRLVPQLDENSSLRGICLESYLPSFDNRTEVVGWAERSGVVGLSST